MRLLRDKETISFKMLQCVIKAHPEKENVEMLRSLEYKSQEYQDFKINKLYPLPCIKPHAVFIDRKLIDKHGKFQIVEELKRLSGYLYYDVDYSDIQTDAKLYKEYMLQQHGDKISMLGRSVGGRGLFFLIKVKGLTVENFNDAYHYFKEQVFNDIPTDDGAKGLKRNFILPSDEDVYVNNQIELEIPREALRSANINSGKSIGPSEKNKDARQQGINGRKHDKYNIADKAFLPISEVLKTVKFKPCVDVGDADFVLQPLTYAKCYISTNKTQVGKRHKTLRALANAFLYNNPDATLDDLLSILNYINQHRTIEPLGRKEFTSTINAEYARIKKAGELNVKLVTQYVHTNPKLDRATRSKIANEQNAILKVNRSIAIIQAAVNSLKDKGEKPTILKVAEILKGTRGKATIQKYWRQIMPKHGEHLRNMLA